MDQSQRTQSKHGRIDCGNVDHAVWVWHRGRFGQGHDQCSRMDQGQNERGQKMKEFIFGIIVTLAVLYPAVTKNLLAQAVDATNGVVTNVLDQNR